MPPGKDKSILLELHKHGVSWIKIDGLDIGNKRSESNVRQLLLGAIDERAKLQFNMALPPVNRAGISFRTMWAIFS